MLRRFREMTRVRSRDPTHLKDSSGAAIPSSLHSFRTVLALKGSLPRAYGAPLTAAGRSEQRPCNQEGMAQFELARLRIWRAPTTSCVKSCFSSGPVLKSKSGSFFESAEAMRMSMRLFTRLTNAFSKKLDNLKAAVALYVAWYNFCRVHQTLKQTPAMAAGLTDHIWNLQELFAPEL